MKELESVVYSALMTVLVTAMDWERKKVLVWALVTEAGSDSRTVICWERPRGRGAGLEWD